MDFQEREGGSSFATCHDVCMHTYTGDLVSLRGDSHYSLIDSYHPYSPDHPSSYLYLGIFRSG
jgi:hypothetical protein